MFFFVSLILPIRITLSAYKYVLVLFMLGVCMHFFVVQLLPGKHIRSFVTPKAYLVQSFIARD